MRVELKGGARGVCRIRDEGRVGDGAMRASCIKLGWTEQSICWNFCMMMYRALAGFYIIINDREGMISHRGICFRHIRCLNRNIFQSWCCTQDTCTRVEHTVLMDVQIRSRTISHTSSSLSPKRAPSVLYLRNRRLAL